jgi:alcohol oxidase
VIRSGIGAAEVLSKNNVPQLVDLPGVGENLMGAWAFSLLVDSSIQRKSDHNVTGEQYQAADYAETMDDLFWGKEDDIKRSYPASSGI